MLVHHRVTPTIKFAGTHLYTWVERGTVRIKNTTEYPWPGLDPGPLAPESNALTMRPPRLPKSCLARTSKTISHGIPGNKFQSSENCADTSKISSSVSFHQYFQAFHMSFKICFRHLVLLEMISFQKIFKTITQKTKFVMQCK